MEEFNLEDLIKININENNEQTVSGRELHQFLELTERYSSWFKRMLQYGFIEDVDFTSVKSFTVVNNGAKKEIDDHLLKISMAKELSMLQRNEKGKQARLYFIKCEEEYKKKVLPRNYKEALIGLLQEIEKNEKLELENKKQKQLLVEYEPKVSYYDLVLKSPNLLTVTQVAKDYGKSGQWLNKFLNEKGIQYKQSGTWLLYQKYAEQGYTKSETFVNEDNGFSKLNTKWTQKGRLFIYDLMKNSGYLPLIEMEEE